MRATSSPTSGSPQEARRPRPSPQVGVYLLLLAMSASSVMRPSSHSLVRHANGLGDGYTAFDFGSNMPELDGLAATFDLREQLPQQGSGRGRVSQRSPRRARRDDEVSDNDDDLVPDETVVEDSAEFDEDAMEIEDDSQVAEAPIPSSFASALSTSSDVQLAAVETSILATILQFLPLADLSNARKACQSFEDAAGWIAPRPFADRALTFIRCGWLAGLPDPIPRPRAPPKAFQWRCLNCSHYSSFHEGCTVCGCNVRQSAARVFVGQLRKRHSALALQHMINLLCPHVTVLHIESHSNREGYEKGAAWLYVDTPENALTMLSLHKRVFFDADETGEEGFWFIEDGRSTLEAENRKTQLFEFATQRKLDENRKRMCLPGQPLVVELPETSMLHGYAPMPLHTAAASASAVSRDNLGWYRM